MRFEEEEEYRGGVEEWGEGGGRGRMKDRYLSK